MPEPHRRTGRVVDLLVAGAFAALAAIQTVIEWRAGSSPTRDAVVGTAGLIAAVLLFRRRRTPAVVMAGTTICAVASALAARHPGIGPLAPAIALYTLAGRTGWRTALAYGVAALSLLTLPPLTRGTPLTGPLAQATAVLSIAALLGLYAGGLRARAAQLEREQTLLAREAVLAERLWIARELHDTVGHQVTLLVVQAGGVRATLPAEHPARPVLDTMISGGKEAMTEMRRMVDVLRPLTDEPATATHTGDLTCRPYPHCASSSAVPACRSSWTTNPDPACHAPSP